MLHAAAAGVGLGMEQRRRRQRRAAAAPDDILLLKLLLPPAAASTCIVTCVRYISIGVVVMGKARRDGEACRRERKIVLLTDRLPKSLRFLRNPAAASCVVALLVRPVLS